MKKGIKLLAFITAFVTMLSFFASCDTSQVQGNTSQAGPTSSGKDTVGYPNYSSGYTAFWSPIYLTTSAMKKESYFGATGNNTKSGITILGKSPDTILVSTLDAGVIQSFDAGALWQNSSIGVDSLGFDAIVSDPNNADFVIGVSTSSVRADGIYISKNGGSVWSYVESCPQLPQGSKIELVFDKSSYSSQTKNSSVIYLKATVPSEQGESILMRSDDTGMTFKTVTSINESARIAIHPTKSYVYLADGTGFYCSINRGFSFEKLSDGSFKDVFVSPAEPDCVFLVSSDGKMTVSYDSGRTFEAEKMSVPANSQNIFVSPVDSNNMVTFTADAKTGVKVIYSSNGGTSWHESAVYDNPHKMSAKSNDAFFAWSPTDASVVYAIINNAIYKSVDCGAFFTWSGNGDDSFDMNGAVSQNIHNPSYIAFALNDNTIAFTNNGSWVWTVHSYADYVGRLNIKAVYPVTSSKLISIVENLQSGEYSLRISTNGGEYFNPTGIDCGANPYFYSDPSDKSIIFASNMRSEDGGGSWKEMNDCDYVLTHNPVSPNELFGVKGNSIVISYDKGNKWQRLVNIGSPALDLSYDYLQSALYAAVGDRLLKYCIKDGTLEECISAEHSNRFGENFISLVEADPLYPNVIYAGGRSDEYTNDSSVLISENSGKNWYVVSSNPNNQALGSSCQGGIQPVDMILSKNRELIVFSAKFGIHKFSAYNPE